jgi:hypothetical protein
MKNLKGFTDFISESARRERLSWLKSKGLAQDHGLRGETIEHFATDLAEIMDLCPNLLSISVPSGSGTSTSVNINREGKEWKVWERPLDQADALDQIVNHLTEMSDRSAARGEIVTFRIWHFEIPGVRGLEKQLVEFGGSGEYQDIDPLALIQFLKQNQELAAEAVRFNISTDSHSDREFAAAMSRGDYGSLD